MSLLVTGTSGHLGRLVVDALLDRGVAPGDVVATARDTAAIAELAARGVQTRHADYEDPASLATAFEGVDRALLVSSSEVGRRLAQHRNVIDAAVAAGVSLLAYTSILHADTSSLALAAEHRATEELLAASGLATVVLRNGWYLENYTENAAVPLEIGQVFGAAGTGRVSAAARRDYAAAAAVVLADPGHAGRVYELAGDEAYSLPEYAAALSAASGREVTYTDLPATEYAAVLTGAGVPEAYAEVLADSDVGLARGELEDHGRQLSTLIGRPTTPLADAVRAALG